MLQPSLKIGKHNLQMRGFQLTRKFHSFLAFSKTVRSRSHHHFVGPHLSHRHAVPCIAYTTLRHNHATSFKCWGCGTEKPARFLTCDECGVVQRPVDATNYFKVLEVPEEFELDLKSLTKRYRLLQTVLHPDKFSNKSEEERTISADYSALVNRAYNTLQTPLKRALHMLSLKGEHIEEDQKVTDPEFLMTIMELNEEVEAASIPDELRRLNERNKQVMVEIGDEIAKSFKDGDVAKAKASVIKLKYYNSVSSYVNGILREKGIVD